MQLSEFRANNPQYSDMTDKDLANSLHRKFYSNMPLDDFYQKIGYTPVRQYPQENAIKEYMKKNASTPGAIAGSLIGGAIGSIGGPKGTVAGTMIGGAIGSGGGSAVSDVMSDRDIDIARALTEAGISLGIDISTFGLGKYAGKPLWEAAKVKFLKGVPAEQIVQELASGAREISNRMGQSVAQSQEILAKEGLSLTPFQTGIVSNYEIGKEILGRTGLLSKNIFESNASKIKEVVQDRLEKITFGSQGLSNDVIGENIYSTIQAGRRALNDSYGNELDRIGTLVAGKKFKLDTLRDAINKHVTGSADDVGRPQIDEAALSIIQDLKKGVGDGATSTGNYLIQFEKRLNKEINKSSKNLDNPQLERDLTEFKKSLQETITKEMNKFGTQAGTEYRKLQNFYSFHQGKLLPDINANIIRGAKGRGLYTSIGKTFASSGKVAEVEKLMGSLDEAYRLIPKNERSKLAFKNFGEAADSIRQSFVSEIFPDLGTANFSLNGYKKISKQLKNPTEAKRMKAILGPKFESFKRTVNLMENAASNPTAGLATLFLRAKEYAAGAGIFGGLTTGVMDTVTAGASALTIFGLPAAMAKAATNPKYVNSLIKADQLASKGTKKAMEAGLLILAGTANDILDELYEENMGSDNFIKELRENEIID